MIYIYIYINICIYIYCKYIIYIFTMRRLRNTQVLPLLVLRITIVCSYKDSLEKQLIIGLSRPLLSPISKKYEKIYLCKFLIFHKIELSRSNIKKFIIFQEMKLYSFKIKIFVIFLGMKHSSLMLFLYFRRELSELEK